MAVLREAREERGHTQIGLSRKMKRALNFVNMVENGDRMTSFCEFIVIAEAMGADPVDLTARVMRKLRK